MQVSSEYEVVNGVVKQIYWVKKIPEFPEIDKKVPKFRNFQNGSELQSLAMPS